MSSAAYATIRQAILTKQHITATYQGRHRVMCPHVIGYKNNAEHALLYQYAGESKTGLEPDGSPNNWRCVFVNQLSNVQAVPGDGKWHSAPNHSRPQTCVDEIDVEVRL